MFGVLEFEDAGVGGYWEFRLELMCLEGFPCRRVSQKKVCGAFTVLA